MILKLSFFIILLAFIFQSLKSLELHASLCTEDKKMLILSQSESESSDILQEYFEAYDSKVIQAFLDESAELNIEKNFFISRGKKFWLDEFYMVYFRTWGNSLSRSLAHKWQPLFEGQGIPCLETLFTKNLVHNKYRMLQLFKDKGIPHPSTIIAMEGSREELLQRIEEKFTNKIVIKAEGSGGKKTFFHSVSDQEGILQTLQREFFQGNEIEFPVVVQKYITNKDSENLSYHFRVIVISAELVLAMRFTAKDSETLASNIALGANSELISLDFLTSEQKNMLLYACNVMHVKVAGVDLILTQEGKMFILDVNNSPGLMTAYKLGEDKHLKKIVQFSQNHRTSLKFENFFP
jgi:glutathione synthase/RimK-type ligase-like ATP-grasp enzyme